MENVILQTLKETTDNEFVLQEIDILMKKSESKSQEVHGNVKNEIKGMKYIMNKHKDILCSYVPTGAVIKNQIMFVWTCVAKKSGVFKKRELQINTKIISYIENCIKIKNKKYAAVLLSIRYHDCKQTELKAHANLLIYNKETNVIERFDPIGSLRSVYDNTKLDKELFEYFNKYGIEYKSPDNFCPKFSFQKLQGKENIFTVGLCVAWSLWYLDLKLSNTHIQDSKQLVNLALDKLKETNKNGIGSLTEFILNYIRHILYT